ncbi:tagaturonate reductase [Fulvivirgaceae bacterium PWU5]|uniref:Tagaturonate reductase n=1 Tax=Dawidia cretensis TaxID=2782350 RepID=A0AAP2DXG6_9BACT|nr:tagaturonate reductase [Dawidia cretensis]MBT1707807.1 tagaturonate reductase [Dawidia cretensis]
MPQLNRHTADQPQTLPVKILQFGEGNFLRAFVDWIVDIMNEKTDFYGAIDVVQPISRGMAAQLREQDGLYHVVLNGLQQGRTVSETRLITCVADAFNPYDDFERFLERARNPELRFILSNTTEAGITFHAADANPNTLADSFPGKVTQLLYHRFQTFQGDAEKGLILIPCELIEKNGDKLRETVLQYADHWQLPTAFKQWIQTANTFCNSLVDRIVPGFPKDTIRDIQQAVGYTDNLVVTAEPFHLWVIEAPAAVQQAFPADQAGLQVKFVQDLTPYRTRKVRILNGAHTALVPVAYLRGLRTVREAVEDNYTGTFLREAIYQEIIPTLDLPASELEQFAADVMERFQNPFIRHELSSIALNSISKYKVRVLPSVLEYYARQGTLPEKLLHALAALILFYKGTHQGETLPVNDTPEILEFFARVWKTGDADYVVRETLANTAFWDQDLTQLPGLLARVTHYIHAYETTASPAV